jgi:hypothetical protein
MCTIYHVASVIADHSVIVQYNALLDVITNNLSCILAGFHPVEGVGGSFPPKTPSFPPKRKERKKKRGKGEREKGKERGRGEHIFFGAAIQVISNPRVKLFLRALD